jgi:DNA-binding response OmpR family regulator
VPRILVVDDEPLISMMVEDWLTELGHEVVGPARSVADGLGLATGTALDGAILDIRLGDGNSYAIASVLQERGIPFAFATGQGESDMESSFQNALILSKPFEFTAVQAVLTALLAGANAAESKAS